MTTNAFKYLIFAAVVLLAIAMLTIVGASYMTGFSLDKVLAEDCGQLSTDPRLTLDQLLKVSFGQSVQVSGDIQASGRRGSTYLWFQIACNNTQYAEFHHSVVESLQNAPKGSTVSMENTKGEDPSCLHMYSPSWWPEGEFRDSTCYEAGGQRVEGFGHGRLNEWRYAYLPKRQSLYLSVTKW